MWGTGYIEIRYGIMRRLRYSDSLMTISVFYVARAFREPTSIIYLLNALLVAEAAFCLDEMDDDDRSTGFLAYRLFRWAIW